jgi:hypothetical protein
MSRKSLNVPEVQVLAAATRLTANDDGARIVLAAAAGFAVTLPPPEAGLEFEFFVRTAPSSGAYTVVTHASANIIVGQVLSSDLNNAADSDFETSGGDTFTFVQSTAVKGDAAKFFCDGVNWYVTAAVSAQGGATITTAS